MPKPARLAAPRARGTLTDALIVEASARLFRARGYDRTNLADVAAELGVTKASLYYHFASKEEILLACVSTAHARLRADLAQVDDTAATGRRRVELMMRTYMVAISRNLWGAMDDERVVSPHGRKLYRGLRGALHAQLEDRISQGVRDGSIVTADVATTAAALLGMMSGARQRSLRRGGLAEVRERILILAFDGLGPRADPRSNGAPNRAPRPGPRDPI